MSLRTATKEDFKEGTKLIDKKEGWSVTIRSKYDDGIWEARAARGTVTVFEREAKFYNVEA